MKLCGGFSLLLKRLELMLNEFFDDIFLKIYFFRFFRELYIRNFRDFFSDEFYDQQIDFTIKKRFFTRGGLEPGISSETTRESRALD